MLRRNFLVTLGGGFATLGLTGCRLPITLEAGLHHPCSSSGHEALLLHPLVQAAWQGLALDHVWDCHAHLLGNGRSGAGVWVSRDFDEGRGIGNMVRRSMFANGACLGDDEARWDQRMVERLLGLVEAMPSGVKIMLLAFDFTYDESGKRRDDLTTFSVSNKHAAAVAAAHPTRFEWVASVHPYRDDALDALRWCKANGARAVKWLPPTMGINLAALRCKPFYELMRQLNLPLLTHVGKEMSVEGAHREDFGHPLALRHPLDHGVRVIAAHCASLGESPDTDANADSSKAPAVENFRLFERLMGETRYEKLLVGDLSATILYSRADYLVDILRKDAWHGRLLNGSDYPLPGILPVISIDHFVTLGLLDPAHVPLLRELRLANPLLFDFVLKRNLSAGGKRFPAAVFETRRFFTGV